ncbi:MAG: NAD(P)H-hydrate dehydratase [Gammaproteobacteria bacterium]|nr:NAD(P)H-hydrate dehydratase [Gammaproteobacteria bacterium]
MTNKKLDFSAMQGWLKPRVKAAHKGMFGHVLVVGGDYGMPGAVRLASLGASQMGAGLVTVITRPEHVTAVVGHQPEILCYGLKLSEEVLFKKLLSQATMIILGPGLGQSTWSHFLFGITINHIKTHQTPCLIDADGLNWLAKSAWTPKASCIYTPHPGEAARLLQCKTDQIQAKRVDAIKALEDKLGGVVVLKGAESLAYTAGEPLSVCKAGNPAMASGGMGDLLSGIIAGLVTQGLSLWQATQMGVLLHAKAGDAALKAKGGPGLLASDLVPELKPLLKASKLV